LNAATARAGWSVLLVEDSQPELERGERLGIPADPEPVLQRLGGLGPAALLAGQHRPQLERVRMLGLGLERPPQRGQRPPAVAHPAQPALGSLEELVCRPGTVPGGQSGLPAPLVERRQLGGAALPCEERLHRLGGLDLQRVQVQHALEGVDGALGLLKHVHPQPARLQPGLDCALPAPGGGCLRRAGERGGLRLVHPQPDAADALQRHQLGGLQRQRALVSAERERERLR
jgi:hypothetical protein